MSGVFNWSQALESYGLNGTGMWTVGVYDGYSSGADTDNWVGVLTLEGLAVPAPGALALLGLAGLAGRRRRGCRR